MEHTAPGEEQVVFSRKAGVVASKISYVDILDSANDWQVLESPHEDEAPPLACQFNYRGTYFMVGDEAGRIDLWSLVPIRLYVKSLDLTRDLLDTLIPPPPFTENANGKPPSDGNGTGKKDNERDSQEHGWSTASVHWSRCSKFVVAAYIQKRKTWPDGEEVLLPGLVLLWSIVEAQVQGYLRLPSRVAHVSLSPVDPRRGGVCCVDGTSFLVDFPAVVTRPPPVARLRGAADFATAGGGKVAASFCAESGGGGGIAPGSASVASVEAETFFAGEGGHRQQQQPHHQNAQKRQMTGVEQRTLIKGHVVGMGEQERTEHERSSQRWDEFRGHRAIGDSLATAAGISEATDEGAVRFEGSGYGRSRSSDGYEMRRDIQEREAPVAAAPRVGGSREVFASLRADECASGGTCAVTSTTEAGILVENGADGVGGDGGGGGDLEEGIDITCGERNAAASMTWHINTNNCAVNIVEAEIRGTRFADARRARTIKIWDPIMQLELFSTATTTAAGEPHCNIPGRSSGDCKTGFDFGSVSDSRTEAGIDAEVNVNASGGEAPLSAGSAASSGSGGSGSKPAGRAPVQPGRTAWCEDGETLFILSHEGNLLKIQASVDGDLSILAKADLHGGASPATLQLTTEGDKVLVATATKGLCLVPSDDLDLSRAEMFGETFGMRGSKTRFWGAAVLADVYGRGGDGAAKRRQTIVGNPSRSRDEKTALFFFDPTGGQPERVDTPRREGVISLACSSLRPLLVLLCPTGEVYFREEVLKTDFPGPWYPSGYVLIDNNVHYLEAEDQLDTVVMIGPNNEILSKTQAHEVVVPWQHQPVSEEASAGRTEEPVDVIGGGDNGLWANASPDELRWIPLNEQTGTLLGGDDEGAGGPRGSPRVGGQENCAGPVARLLGATPAVLKEARKRFRGSTVFEEDAALKRRKLVPNMMEILAAKKKKYDEEAVKRKRKLEESRAKAKRLRQKKAAASEERAAERAASARRWAVEREVVPEEAAELMSEVAAAAGRDLVANAAVREERKGVAAELQRVKGLELLPAKAGRGDGGRGKSTSTGTVLVDNTGGASGIDPRHHPHWAMKTPVIGKPGNTPNTKDGWRASGGDGSVGVDGHPFRCGVAADPAVRVTTKSAAAKEHAGTAAKDSRVVSGGTDNSNHSSSLAKRPGGALSNPSATAYDASCSLSPSRSTKKSSAQRKTMRDRRGGGKRGANSEPSVHWTAGGSSEAPWSVDGSTESLWGSAGLLLDGTPTSRGAPGSSEALHVLPNTRASKKGWRWSSPGSPEGTWAAASAAAAVALAAEAREEAARGMSPTESNASARRCLHGDDAGGVEYGLGSGGVTESSLRPLFSCSGSSIQGTVGGSRCGVGGSSVAASTCNQTVFSQAAPRSTMVVASSGRQIPISRRSLSPSLSRGMPHHRPSSSATHSPSLRHVSPPPGANWRQLPLPLSPPHPFRGVSMLAEALAHGQPDATPTLPPASAALPARLQLESRRLVSAVAAPVGERTISETATSHRSWVKDVACSAARGVGERECVGLNEVGVGILASAVMRQQQQQQQQPQQEGTGLGDGDSGAGDMNFNGKDVSPHDHAVVPPNMTASVTSLACEQQHSHRGPPLPPPTDSTGVLGPTTAEGTGFTMWETSATPVAGIDRVRGLKDGGT